MAEERTLEVVKEKYEEVHKPQAVREKLSFYDKWASTYDQDAAVIEFSAPILAAKTLSAHFSGERGEAKVLDVCCGTGQVTKQLSDDGFTHFVGLDGSPNMLEKARKTGLYKDLKLCIMGEKPLPVPKASFDVVVLAGALSVGHLHYSFVRQLCDVSKPGGYICLTCRCGGDNLEYKAALERELWELEQEGLWSRAEVTQVQNWEKSSLQDEDGYISGTVYLYKKL